MTGKNNMRMAFIVGTGRCGSSLIHEILAKHEDVGFISNVDDNLSWLNLKGKFNNQIFRSFIGNFTRKGRLRFAPSEAYRLFTRQVSPLYERSSRDLSAEDVTPWLCERTREFFQQRHEIQARRVFLHKYTGWSRIGYFSSIYPDAQFIHVVRDGRAVANSWLQMPWWGGYKGPENWLWGKLPSVYETEWEVSGRSFIVLAGIGWKLLLDSYEQAIEQLQEDRCLGISYEEFLKNPKEVMSRALEFMGLNWTRKFEKHFRRQRIYSSRSNAFEKDLSAYQLRQLEESLEDKLRKYGYRL